MSDEFKVKLQQIIDHLKSTGKDEWCKDVVRTKDSKQNCLFGHVFNMGGDDNKLANKWWDFMEMCATTYMVYPVNDGSHPDYKQDNPRDRCIAYLEDLLAGKQLTTLQSMEEDAS